jgi:hypothetical protein
MTTSTAAEANRTPTLGQRRSLGAGYSITRSDAASPRGRAGKLPCMELELLVVLLCR